MKPTIIIVDDIQEIREELVALLQSEFEILAHIGDGPTAVREILSQAPRLVLLDVVMPGMSGIEVLKKVMATPGYHPHFVMMSAVKDEKIVLEALQSGAKDYLYKPAPEMVIKDTLRRLVS